jgi:hypothetical protein
VQWAVAAAAAKRGTGSKGNGLDSRRDGSASDYVGRYTQAWWGDERRDCGCCHKGRGEKRGREEGEEGEGTNMSSDSQMALLG